MKMMLLKNSTAVKVFAYFPKAVNFYYIFFATFLSCFIIFYFVSGLLAFAILLGTCFGIFYNVQDNLLFYPDLPNRSFVALPIGLPYEVIYVKTRDKVTLHSFLIRHPGDKGSHVPTVVFVHGNAGNIGGRLQNAAGMFQHLQCNVFLLEYRGYGMSSGTPSEKGLYLDIRAAIDYLFTRHDVDKTQIIIFGRSLGGAVAIDCAADTIYGNNIMCTLAENTFTSIPDMAKHLIPYVKYIPICFHKNKFSSINKVSHISKPILFISGLDDQLVPASMMSKLYNHCRAVRKQLFQISNAGHMDTWLNCGYYQGIAQFLTECKELKSSQQTSPPRLNLLPIIEEV